MLPVHATLINSSETKYICLLLTAGLELQEQIDPENNEDVLLITQLKICTNM